MSEVACSAVLGTGFAVYADGQLPPRDFRPVWPSFRFITPDPVGNPVWPVLVGAWRPGELLRDDLGVATTRSELVRRLRQWDLEFL